MLTSTYLQIGSVYTREQLRERFSIQDMTVNTGIFQPKGHESVWLFVTERKTTDRTQYNDHLAGDTLQWEGQTSGRKDALIAEHRQRGLELLLFYRKEKYEFAGAGFRYEGPFSYSSHVGANPARFTLIRVTSISATVMGDIQAAEAEETFIEGRRTAVLTNHFERNPALRAAAIKIHGYTCQICGFNFERAYGTWGREYIEVHHLRPVSDYDCPTKVNPRTDMAVVCANCHRMLHRSMDRPLTPAELQSKLRLSC